MARRPSRPSSRRGCRSAPRTGRRARLAPKHVDVDRHVAGRERGADGRGDDLAAVEQDEPAAAEGQRVRVGDPAERDALLRQDQFQARRRLQSSSGSAGSSAANGRAVMAHPRRPRAVQRIISRALGTRRKIARRDSSGESRNSTSRRRNAAELSAEPAGREPALADRAARRVHPEPSPLVDPLHRQVRQPGPSGVERGGSCPRSRADPRAGARGRLAEGDLDPVARQVLEDLDGDHGVERREANGSRRAEPGAVEARRSRQHAARGRARPPRPPVMQGDARTAPCRSRGRGPDGPRAAPSASMHARSRTSSAATSALNRRSSASNRAATYARGRGS